MLHQVQMTKDWAHYGYNLIPRISKIEVPVQLQNGTVVDTREIYGAMATASSHKIIRVYSDKDTYQDLLKAILRLTDVVEKKTGLKMAGSPDGWCKRDLKQKMVYMDILFTKEGFGARSRSEAYRRIKILCRGNRNSRDLGTLRTAVVEGGSLALLDGQSVVYIGSLGDKSIHTSCIQWTGYADLSRFLHDRDNWGMINKGMARVIDRDEHSRLCSEYGLNPKDVDVIVPIITVKFAIGATITNMQYATMQIPTVKNYMTLGLQPMLRLPLTEHGQKVILATYKEILKEIREAYQDKTGRKVMALFTRLLQEEVDDEEDPEKKAILARKLEEMGSTVIKMSMLPRKGEVFINKTISTIFEKRAKSIRLDGCTAKALADPTLGRYEIRIPRRSAKRGGIKIGDIVTCFRYPNTGIECFEAVVVGFTDEDNIFINATLWAERCSGDMDGDTIAVGYFNGIVDVAALETRLSTKKASEKSGELDEVEVMSLAEVIAMQFHIKLRAVTDADRFITTLHEQNGDLELGSSIMQLVLDLLKGKGTVPDIQAMAERMYPGIGLTAKPIYSILKGNLGEAEREVIFKYNHMIYNARTELSVIPWLKSLDSELFYLLTPTERIDDGYGDVITAAYATFRKLAGVKAVNRPDLKKKAPYKADRFDDNKIALVKSELMKEYAELIKSPGVSDMVVRVHNAYDQWCVLLRDGKVEEAYDKLTKLVDVMRSKPEGYAKVLRLLWICITVRIKIDGMKVTNLEHRTVNDKVASGYTMFSHFPILLGSWDLQQETARLGGLPDMDIIVLQRK